MKNIILLALINFVLIGYSYSQTRSVYIFDNSKSAKDKGVRVVITETHYPPSPKTTNKPSPKTENKNSVNKPTPTTSMRNDSSLNKRSATNVNLVNKTVMSSPNRALGGYSTGDWLIDSYIVESATRYGIDPLLIYAQMNQESAFKIRATSYKGASGLMQLMPATAVRFGVTDIYDPKQNIEGGVRYMRWLLDKFGGNLSLALAGYNAGEGAVMKYGYQIPPYNETQEYVRRISARYYSIKRVNSPKTVKTPVQQRVVKSEIRQLYPPIR